MLCTHNVRGLSPRELVEHGFRDLVSPFIKQELHPPRKVAKGAWRIVQCVSLVDQLIERILYTRAVLAVKTQYPESDAVVGIGFTDSMCAEFHAEARLALGPDLKATDVAGWDRSLGQGWVLEAAESIIRSATRTYPAWETAVRNHAWIITNPAFIVPDGQKHAVVVRPKPGGMLSGSFMTTMFNTLARLDVSDAAGSLRCKAAGDDALERFTPGYDYIKAYADLGFEIRESTTKTPGVFEFCSHEYRDSQPSAARLVSWRKAVMGYFSRRVNTIEQFSAILHELRHNVDEIKFLYPYLETRFREDGGVVGVATDKTSKLEQIKDGKQQEEECPEGGKEESWKKTDHSVHGPSHN